MVLLESERTHLTGRTRVLPFLVHEVSAHAMSLRLRGVEKTLTISPPSTLPPAHGKQVGILFAPVSAAQYPSHAYPCQRLTCSLARTGACVTRGCRDWLGLRCTSLPYLPLRRYIPAHCHARHIRLQQPTGFQPVRY